MAILELYFQCQCQRCNDSTDADDLHMDSIRCQECRRKNDNQDPPSYFPHGKSCPKCGWVENEDVTRQMKSEMNELKKDWGDISGRLDLFKKYQEKHLHPNHQLLIELRRWIIPLLCRPTQNDPRFIKIVYNRPCHVRNSWKRCNELFSRFFCPTTYLKFNALSN